MAYWSPLFFPFAIPEPEAAPDPDVGAAITEDQLHKWCFRVRKWRCTFQNPTPEGGPAPDPIVIDVEAYNVVGGEFDGDFLAGSLETLCEDERAFDVAWANSWLTLIGTRADGVAFGDEGGYSFLFFGPGHPTAPITHVRPGFYRVDGVLYFVPYKTNDDYANIRLVIDGVEITGTEASDELYRSVIIEPLEYWEHDPDDGSGPAYDSATGAMIRSVWDIQSTPAA
ncbi:MAG TPA: hypothetical protein DIT13_10140 [Verrucomicrobiales bacterium]|nr:hypothetical protein [Verrucomicrobiales bacterium]HRJ71163.1 hypothetical protein [Terrimicrobiaceae bacterium]